MIRRVSLIIFALVAAFFLSQVGIPEGFEWLNPLMMVSIAGLSFVPLMQKNGWKAGYMLLMLGLTGFVIEYIAIKTCFPYGCFSYSILLGAKVFDTVPRTVFIARSPLVIGISGILNQFFFSPDKKETTSQRQYFFLATIILVLCDMVLDPGAVLFGFWTFVGDHRWYNVPWVNFAGWILSGFLGFVEREYRKRWYNRSSPKKWEDTNHISDALYVMIIFWTTIAGITGMWGAFLIGIVLCIVGLYCWRKDTISPKKEHSV